METTVKNLSRFSDVCSGIALQIRDKLKRVVCLEKLVQFAVLSEVASYGPIRNSDLLNAILQNSLTVCAFETVPLDNHRYVEVLSDRGSSGIV